MVYVNTVQYVLYLVAIGISYTKYTHYFLHDMMVVVVGAALAAANL